MARDRTAVLIKQAACAGVVDFTRARPFDPAWWRWLHSRLDQLEARNLVRLYALQHAQNVAALPVTTGDGVKDHWERANGLLVKVFNRLFPWLQKDEEADAAAFERSVDQLQKMWAAEFGDPADPATQERIWATACALDPTLRRN